MSETTVNTPAPVTVRPPRPDISALQQAVVETFFGIIQAPDDPEALAGGARVLAELDAALDAPSEAAAGV